MMNFGEVEALTNMLGGDASRESRDVDQGPVVKNNANAGVDPLFKTVIKSGPSSASNDHDHPSNPKKPQKPAPVDTRAIWTAEEIERAKELEEDDEYGRDGRAKPEYDILYVDSVTAEDVFMGLSMKDGSSRGCGGIQVKIDLPGLNDVSQVDLDVTASRMRVRSPHYHLFLHLPHQVDPQAARAKWDARSHALRVTMPITKREEDDDF